MCSNRSCACLPRLGCRNSPPPLTLDPIRAGHLHQGVSRMPWLPSRFLLAPLPVPFSVGRFVLLRSCPILAASVPPEQLLEYHLEQLFSRGFQGACKAPW